MAKGKLNIARAISIVFLSVISITFLMGDFCQDVLSIPIEVDYTTEDKNIIELTVDFSEFAETGVDGDVDFDLEDMPDGDFDSDYEMEINFKEEGYDLSAYHVAIDFAEEEPTIKDYKNNLVGIFVRSIKYEIVENSIPATIPGIKIYLSQKVSSSDANAGAETFDWDSAINSGDIKTWVIPEVGEGENGLVKLGETEPEIYEVPIKNFPVAERILERQDENIDVISDTILSNFKFEIVVIPSDPVILKEENVDLANSLDDLIGTIKLKLHLVVVFVVKA